MSVINPKYNNAVFITNTPTGDFPTRFGIVTACNPNGVTLAKAENSIATAQLNQHLEGSGRAFFLVTGCSPDMAHQEPGFGVVLDSARDVVELGRAWKQEAVFWVEKGIVYLLPCGDGERTVIGSWKNLVQPQGRTQAELRTLKADLPATPSNRQTPRK